MACDRASGELGVAVQSHWFSVGSVVPWACPGVGAVATQSIAEPSYGPRVLALLAGGAVAKTALEQATSEDPESAVRQVAVVDAGGHVAVHTGGRCIAFAGQAVGDGFACQANMMSSELVWTAMSDAYSASDGPLARRLLVALEAGEDAGGDVRGRQSAAMLVVPAEGEPWEATVSLRVEDHPEPLAEMRRLLRLHDAYATAEQADAKLGEGRHDQAATLYRRARELAPENLELRFWAGLGAAQTGELDAAIADVREVINRDPAWLELLRRLPPELAPAAEIVLAGLREPPGRSAPRD